MKSTAALYLAERIKASSIVPRDIKSNTYTSKMTCDEDGGLNPLCNPALPPMTKKDGKTRETKHPKYDIECLIIVRRETSQICITCINSCICLNSSSNGPSIWRRYFPS
uniref:Protease Do-like 5ic n=1 Tax=Rhizophora mucronata TaxID=61149 RepID=A0A2P2KH24_RHIMU